MTAGNISLNQDLDFDTSYRFGKGAVNASGYAEPDKQIDQDEDTNSKIEKKFTNPGLSAKQYQSIQNHIYRL